MGGAECPAAASVKMSKNPFVLHISVLIISHKKSHWNGLKALELSRKIAQKQASCNCTRRMEDRDAVPGIFKGDENRLRVCQNDVC